MPKKNRKASRRKRKQGQAKRGSRISRQDPTPVNESQVDKRHRLDDTIEPARRRSPGQGFRSEIWVGAIPPPSALREIEEIVPGGAERLIRIAEKNSDHRRDMESRVISGNVESQKKGVLYAFTICMTLIVGGLVLLYFRPNVPLAGAAPIVTAIVGLCTVFITGKIQQARERKERRDEMREGRLERK